MSVSQRFHVSVPLCLFVSVAQRFYVSVPLCLFVSVPQRFYVTVPLCLSVSVPPCLSVSVPPVSMSLNQPEGSTISAQSLGYSRISIQLYTLLRLPVIWICCLLLLLLLSVNSLSVFSHYFDR